MRIVLWAALVCSGNALLATLHRSAPLLRSPYPVAPRHASPLGEASVTSIPYEDLTIGVIKEDKPLEKRVAQSPDSVALLVKAKFKVVVEEGAGVASEFSDDQYEAVGATIVSSAEAWKSDIVIKINPPSSSEAKLVGDRTLISQINPAKNAALLTQFEQQGSTVFALDCIPRMLSRGQTFDTLSSQTNIAGYRAVIEASRRVSLASRLPPTVPLPCRVAGVQFLRPLLRRPDDRGRPRAARQDPRARLRRGGAGRRADRQQPGRGRLRVRRALRRARAGRVLG